MTAVTTPSAEGKIAGRQRSAFDMIVAAVAGANDVVVASDHSI